MIYVNLQIKNSSIFKRDIKLQLTDIIFIVISIHLSYLYQTVGACIHLNN